MTEEKNQNEPQYCYKHPDRQTYLRCNKCNRPICTDCAVQTPTGYRCKDCIKEQQQIFNTSEKKDYVIGAVIAFAIGFVGAYLYRMIPLMGFFSAIIIGGLMGRLIPAAVRAAVHKRRSDTLTTVVTAAAALGGLLGDLQSIIININMMSWGMAGVSASGMSGILITLLYIAAMCAAILSDMNGTFFKR